jgi:Tfp pilus assembly protein PilO
MKFFLPIIFIIVGIAVFMGLISPIYADIQELTLQAESYNEALANSKRLQARRDDLTKTYNSFSRQSVDALEIMIPNSVDNIGLIQEIQRMALELGIVVKNVNFDPNQVDPEDGEFEEGVEKDSAASNQQQNQTLTRRGAVETNGLYDTFLLEFTIEGSYSDFVRFLQELETNLRIVDISNINFTSSSLDNKGNLTDVYDYTFTTRTYRLITE